MSQNTGIQWTDATWNPVVGCEHVSPGCDNCYAKTLHDMRHKARLAGKRVLPLYDQPFETVQLRPHKVGEPLRWRKPRRVFVNSMSDLFHKDVPEWFLDDVWKTMEATPQHTYQILTKRPHRMRAYVRGINRVLPNVWLGTSTENQATLDKRLPMLMETPAAVRFLSMEPLLEAVEIGIDDIASRDAEGRYVDWVIIGGESGTKARPCHVEWVEEILAECWEFGVPAFVKQLGRWIEGDHMDRGFLEMRWLFADGSVFVPPIIGEHTRTRPRGAIAFGLADNHGGNPKQWPERLRVRQFPGEEVAA